ncbi:LysM peptidoglycan-binding domain-containing protein [Solibacillus sp. CAU 1738]|uniref:LysM peptidoglycan-binding domain-containing protein n=1 Tax=Solibacillus sp. CAU 1738 TaxID=3140363 RepID=UPI0032610910
MAKKDYREKIEEHRQEIELEEVPSRMSRANKKQDYKKSPLMRNLTIFFIFIPLLVLGYVRFFYEPKTPAMENDVEQQIEVQTNKPSTPNSNNQATTGNEKEDAETENKEETGKIEKEAAEADKIAKEQAAKIAEQKAKEEEAKKLAAQQAQQASPKTYTVKTGDTLYSISRAHYNGEIRVQGIIQANNLSSENITVGQTLIIPQ